MVSGRWVVGLVVNGSVINAFHKIQNMVLPDETILLLYNKSILEIVQS